MGCLAFWLRRTDTINSVLLNICVAFNAYPLVDLGSSFRWSILIIPLFFISVIPAHYVLNPNLKVFLVEGIGSLLLYGCAYAIFKFGLKKYQSSSAIALKV